MESKGARIFLGIWTFLIMLFLFIPIAIIVVYAFNASNIQSWPIAGYSLKWFSETWHNQAVRDALWLSVKVGLFATTISLTLGCLAAFAVHYYRFPGRESIAFLVVLPIALPGIITGMALSSFFVVTGVNLSMLTIIIGHATFCIVIVYNNVIARLRRISRSMTEASMDLGGDTFYTFRRVTLPILSTAIISGGILAFALSFDEVIVTTFTAGAQNTLPLWIFGAIRLGQKLPEVNVVVSVVMLFTLIPVLLSYRMMNRAPADGGR